MTFVGKILVVVQVVLSICFAAFAGAVYTAHQNWKADRDTVQTRLTDTQRSLDDLDGIYQAEKTSHEKAITDLTSRAETAEADLRTKTLQYEQQVQRNDNLNTELNNQRTLASLSSEEATMRKEEATIERSRNKQLHDQLEVKNNEIVQLRDDLFNRDTLLSNLNEKHLDMLEDFAFLQEVVRKNRLSTDPKDYSELQEPPPVVTGLVLNSRRAKRSGTEYVEISLGEDDGIQRGHQLHIIKPGGGGQYLAMIQIVYATPDRAVGTVITKAKNGQIERGDNVTSKI